MEFDVEKTVSYWVESAAYDMDVAKALFFSGKYPYALFFGHLAIEKILKALVVRETGLHAPHTHSLPLLASKVAVVTEEIRDKISGYMEFHLQARYPDDQRSFYRKCTKQFTEKNLQEIEWVYKWLKERL